MRIKLFVVMLLLSWASFAVASGPTFNMGTVNGTAGQQVIIPITLTNNGASIAALSIDIGFDPSRCSPVMNAGGTAPLAALRGPAIQVTDEAGDFIKNIAQSIPSAGVLRLGISATNTIAIGDGVVVNVKFNVAPSAFGALTLTNLPGASAPDASSVSITGTNGLITLPAIAPGAPTIGAATAGDGQALVSFSAPTSDGGATITGYTVTSNPSGGVDSSVDPTSLSRVITGLSNGTAYTFTVTASNSAGTGLASGPSTSVTPKGNQTITFGALPSLTYGATGTVSASAGSSLPVTFTSSSTGVCTVSGANGSTVTPVSAGTCTIVAHQDGDDVYNAAPPVTRNITIAKANQATVTATAPASAAYGQLGLTAGADGGSGTGAYAYDHGTSTACMVNATTGALTITSGSGTCSITATRAADGNYNVSAASAPVTVAVTKANPVVSPWPTASAIVYGQALASSVLSGGVATPLGTFAFSDPSITPAAGTNAQSVTFTPTDLANYNTATGTVDVDVSKATPSITWNTPAAVFVGTSLSATQLDASSVVDGTFAYSPASGTVMGTVGSPLLSTTFTPTDTANYNPATASVTLTVSSKLVPTITWSAPAAITYGTALSVTQLDATASVPGTFSYNPAAGTVLNAGIETVTATFTPTDTVTYAIATKTASITVNKAPATVTLDLATLTQTYSGTEKTVTATTIPEGLATSITYNGSSTAPTAAGTYPINATITEANYAGSADGSLTIAKAGQTVTFAATAGKIYGDADFGPGASASSLLPVTYASDNTAVATITADGFVHIVGAGTAVITATQAGDNNYLSATAEQALTVDKASLTVSAVNASRPFNTENPSFSVSYAGFVSGDTPSVLTGAPPVITTTATIDSLVGSYPITVSPDGLASPNYSFTFVEGTLAVGLASQTINFAALPAKTYGGSDFELSATGGASNNPITFTSSNEAVATITGTTVTIVGAGSTDITASQAGDATKFASATTLQKLTINKAPLTVTVDNAERVYGAANPIFDATATGFVNNDTDAILTGAPIITTTATAASQVGSYTISATQGSLSAANNNYSFIFVDGTLAVGLASQTITFDAVPVKIYGEAAFDLSATGGGSNNPVTFVSSNEAVAKVIDKTVTIVGAGSATITASQASDHNYASATTQQTLTVAKAPLTVSTLASRAYGAANPVFAPIYTGFVNNDTATAPALQGAPSFVTTADATSPAGNYTISTSVGNLSSNNYTLNFVDGTLTVTKADQTIDFAPPASVTYLGTPITLSAVASSGLAPVTFSVSSGPGSWDGTTLTFNGAGTILVQASQAGDANYNSAQVTKSITVQKAAQTIGAVTFNPGSLVVGGSTAVSASAGSGLGVSFSSLSESVCTVNGSTVIGVSAGTCSIAANQAGNGNFNAAPQTATDLTVSNTVPGAPTNIFALPGNTLAKVSFSAPAFNGGSAVTGFIVTSNPAGGTDIDAGTTATTHTITGLTNGTPYTFTVTAGNVIGSGAASAASNSVTPNRLITDVGAPSKTIANSGATVTYTVTYTGAENITLAAGNVALIATGSASGAVTVTGSGNTERTVSISNLTGDGTLGISIAAGTATSAGGAISAIASAASATFTVDTTLPALNVITLADNTVTGDNTLNVSGETSDSNLVATVTVNGDSVTVTDGKFNTAVTLQDGANTITVAATDGAGNLKTDTRTVFHDLSVPVITFSAPTPAVDSITAQESATISGSLNKPGSVKIKVNGDSPIDATMTGNNFSAQITLSLGQNIIKVTASDTAVPVANVSTVQRSVTFDNTKPSVAINDPAQDITTTLSSYLVKVSAADQYTDLTLAFSVDGVAVTPAPVPTNGNFEQRVSFSAGKTYAVSVGATDQAGNTSTVQRNIVFRPLSIADAMRALQISVGNVQQTEQDNVLDVAPLVNGVPAPDGTVDVGDAAIIMRKLVELVNW